MNASRWKQTKSPSEHDLDLEVARGAALALWSCSKSVHSRSSIFRAGSVPLLAKLVKEDKDEFLIPVVGLVQECAVEVRPKDKLYIILLTSLLFAATLTKVKKNKTPKPWCAWNDGNSGNIALHFSFVLLAFFLSFVPIFPLIPLLPYALERVLAVKSSLFVYSLQISLLSWKTDGNEPQRRKKDGCIRRL